jgi:hypothetical protein
VHQAHQLEALLQLCVNAGDIEVQTLLGKYCYLLYHRHGTFEAVAKRARLDRRTAKKYVQQGRQLTTGMKASGS